MSGLKIHSDRLIQLSESLSGKAYNLRLSGFCFINLCILQSRTAFSHLKNSLCNSGHNYLNISIMSALTLLYASVGKLITRVSNMKSW